MSAASVSIVLPVFNGADTVAGVIESVLTQTHAELELIISDNASTDGTGEICRRLARADPRVVYRRHEANVGLTNNFVSAARHATAPLVRWIGDDDALEPTYVSRVLEVFAESPHLVAVTTQITYVDLEGFETLSTTYDPAALASPDPIMRLSAMLTLLTSGYALVDPLYATMRRELAVLPRTSMLREDEVFASRMALAGPWGHVAAPLAHRHRSEVATSDLVRLLDVPRWHARAMELLVCRQLLHVIAASPLDPAQRRQARIEVWRMYGRRKRNLVRRGVAKVGRLAERRASLSPSGAR